MPSVSSSDKIPITIDKVAWNNECLESMREKLACCLTDIEQAISNIEVDDKSSIDGAVNDITGIINDATCECRKVITVTKTQRNINVTDDKPWFNQECRNLHNIYKNDLRIFNANRSHGNRQVLCESRLKYKKYSNRKKLEYQLAEGNKLALIRKDNPKLFHKRFNKRNLSHNCDISNDEFYDYFRELYNDENVDTSNNYMYNKPVYEELDEYFTESEVSNAIKDLKCGKSCGIDLILNEYFINFNTELTPFITTLFNKILSSGYFPKQWCEAIIIPIFKKGDRNDTNNYRGISLMSCFAKLFTSLLNKRLLYWSQDNDIISDAQFGFKPGSGTRDAIFALHSIINDALNEKRKLYCCFVDYKRAFDSIDRTYLWKKNDILWYKW